MRWAYSDPGLAVPTFRNMETGWSPVTICSLDLEVVCVSFLLVADVVEMTIARVSVVAIIRDIHADPVVQLVRSLVSVMATGANCQEVLPIDASDPFFETGK